MVEQAKRSNLRAFLIESDLPSSYHPLSSIKTNASKPSIKHSTLSIWTKVWSFQSFLVSLSFLVSIVRVTSKMQSESSESLSNLAFGYYPRLEIRRKEAAIQEQITWSSLYVCVLAYWPCPEILHCRKHRTSKQLGLKNHGLLILVASGLLVFEAA